MPWLIEGLNYCDIFGQEVNYDLVKIQAPACITKYRGCGNCPHCKYVTIQKGGKRGDPQKLSLLFDGGYRVPHNGEKT